MSDSSAASSQVVIGRFGWLRGSLAATLLAAAMPLATGSAASAQYSPTSDANQPYLDSPSTPRTSKPRRNDAYQPTEPTSSLGVLTSRDGAGQGTAVAQAAPDVYSPRYGEPVRPYESYDRVPLQPVPSPNTYPPPSGPRNDAYRPPYASQGSQGDSRAPYRDGPVAANQGYGQPYSAPPDDYARDRYDDGRGGPRDDRRYDGTYSSGDILSAGHGFFGSMSQGLGNIIENAFKRQGRPNGYILGEEGGGAFVAGLRYGEGTLYTRDAGTHRVYWQGPSLGYDFGGAGSKVMMLVYNLRSPEDIYERFGGVDGSAYLVGGLGMTVLKRDYVTVAPIRTGVGLRLGANVGYLKFTHRPTWNPF